MTQETTAQELTPEELLAKKLGEARNALIKYAADMFWLRKWRVRVTADWGAEGSLVLRCEPTIDNYSASIEFSRDRLLDDDQSKNHAEIDALPDGMIDAVFGGAIHLIAMGS